MAYLTLLPEKQTGNPHIDYMGPLTVQIDALEPFKVMRSHIHDHSHTHTHTHDHAHAHKKEDQQDHGTLDVQDRTHTHADHGLMKEVMDHNDDVLSDEEDDQNLQSDEGDQEIVPQEDDFGELYVCEKSIKFIMNESGKLEVMKLDPKKQ